MEENTRSNLNDFWDYIQHLCEVFIKLKRFNELKIDSFIEQQSTQTSTDFFLDNLFWFDKTTLDNTNPYQREIEGFYNSVTNKLYHYTSLDTLEKIVKGNKLKLSNLRNMNDSMEGYAFIEYLKNRTLKNKEANELLHKSLTLIPEYAPKIFSFSLSALKDDAAQWQRYSTSNDAKTSTPYGVCIEFSKEKLLNQISQIHNLSLKEIVPVLYVPHYEKNNIFLEIIFTLTLRALNKDIPSLENLYKTKPELLAEYLSFYSADIKHDSFKNERELRLIISLKNMPESITCDSIFINLLQNNKTVLPDLITSITAGPCPENYREEYTETIKNLLKRNKLDDMIERVHESNCPLR